jgi:hypothetical protein
MQKATASAISEALLEHVITPFGLPREFLTDQGSNFLSGGLAKFLAAGNIAKTNTLGYHPRTNGKNERYNGILKAALFKLNTTCDLSRWEDFLPAALYSTCIHRSDSSKFSPFELTYGVSPWLATDPARMLASDLVCPGEDELRKRIRRLNDKQSSAVTNVAKRSLVNKTAFDKRIGPEISLFCEGDVIKLHNEAHVKGAPRWYGTFEVKKVLPNNVYILLDQDGVDYLRPVSGNSLRPVSLRSLITMTCGPPLRLLPSSYDRRRLMLPRKLLRWQEKLRRFLKNKSV